MEPMSKVGIVAVLGSMAVPATVISTRGSSYTLFEENKNPNFVPAKSNNAHAFLRGKGYYEKHKDKLVDFDKNRVAKEGGLFGLGCHRLLFEGKNVRRLKDTHAMDGGSFLDAEPIKERLNDETKPILGCSTSAMMKWEKENERAYEFELAVKRGDTGFIERISVLKDKAISQLVIYTKNNDPKTNKANPWRGFFGVQRTMGKGDFKIGNPIDETWTDLNIEQGELDKPLYFSVWVADPKEPKASANNKGLLTNLGIKTKNEDKLFSSLAKTNNPTEWWFRFFGHQENGFDPKQDPNEQKNKTNYTSKIEEDVSKSKGVWKDVKAFCESQESVKKGPLEEADIYRLRDYCYTK